MGKSEITITNKGGLNTSLVIIIFVLLILGGAGYYFMNKSKEKWVNLQAVEANNLKADIANKNNLININTASIQELDTLPGIGEATANKIVNYREEKGKFNSIEEIKNVNGIGDKKYEELKTLISIE